MASMPINQRTAIAEAVSMAALLDIYITTHLVLIQRKIIIMASMDGLTIQKMNTT
jgi:hypothetical protein